MATVETIVGSRKGRAFEYETERNIRNLSERSWTLVLVIDRSLIKDPSICRARFLGKRLPLNDVYETSITLRFLHESGSLTALTSLVP